MMPRLYDFVQLDGFSAEAGVIDRIAAENNNL